jgi:hypothetical protein
MQIYHRDTDTYEDVPDATEPEPVGDTAEYEVQTLIYSLSLRRYIEPGTRMLWRDHDAEPLLAAGAIAPVDPVVQRLDEVRDGMEDTDVPEDTEDTEDTGD